MICSIILFGLLLVIVGFLELVRLRSASCEGGVYYAPLDSAEAWSASLDVALGLDYFAPDSVDASWSMLPLARPWEGAYTAPLPIRAPKGRPSNRALPVACPTYTLRTLAYICMC